MAENINAVVKNRSQTASVLNSTNPILFKGELGIESDTRKFKFGDGVTAWNGLAYASFDEVSTYMKTVLQSITAKEARSALKTNITNVDEKNDSYIIADSDKHELIEATGGADGITITLPTLADNAGRVIKIIKVDADPGLITIDGEGAETINGEETQLLTSQNAAITMYAGATEWKLLNAAQKTALTVSPMTADYTVTDTDEINIIEVTTGDTDKTITLPTLADNQGREIMIKKVDSGTGAVYVAGEGAETVEGAAGYSIMGQHKSVKVYAGPTQWGISAVDAGGEGDGLDVLDVLFTLATEEKPGFKFPLYQKLSKTVYAEAWQKAGHLYAKDRADALAADAEGKFHLPAGQFLFSRIGATWPIVSTSIDTGTDRISFPSHPFEIDGSQNGRPIKLLRVAGQTPVMPTGTGYEEYSQNYLRVIDADTIELYDTEAHAIDTANTTGRVDWTSAGSGTLMLTTQGCYQADAFQRFFLGNSAGVSSQFLDNYTPQGDGNSGWSLTALRKDVKTAGLYPVSDSIHGTPRNTNETRGAYASIGMQIKVISTSVATGQAYDMEVWTTDWVQKSTFSGLTETITHNFEIGLSGLIIKAFVSTDGTDATAKEIGLFQDTYYMGSYYVRGAGISAIDNESFLFTTASGGLVILGPTTGEYIVPPNSYYKIVVYKPSFFSITKTSPLVTVTSSQSIALETVERTAVIPASVTQSLDLTITAGVGINETNVIWIKNKSDYIQHVLYGAQTFNIAPGQRVMFRIADGALVWASAGWEHVHDFGHVSTSGTFYVGDGYYRVYIRCTGASSRLAHVNVHPTEDVSYGVWDINYHLNYTKSTGIWNTTLSGYFLGEVYKWHEAA